jgi:two-component system NtrC family sensor kinase
MLRRRLTDPKILAGIDAIRGAARRGESLTRQLLTFSRRQPLNPVPIDLQQRLVAVRGLLVSSLRGNISLAVDIPHDVWPVEVDVVEFELALVNLAVNARDAMPQGGTFKVSARNVPASAVRSPGSTGSDQVELTLSDTGVGIAADDIPKVFDPFFTTKAVGKGTGLGLSQVYGFANQSGGAVNVKSEVGRGTTIILALPRSSSAAPAMADTGRLPHQPGEPVDATILMVEDNPEVGEVTATLLEQIGYRVLRAGNAPEALAKMEGGDRIDLLFSDIVMPNGMNGIHLAQVVSERFPKTRVLLTTGYSEVAAAAESRFSILRKPFVLSSLERAVREAMAGTRTPPARRARG